MARLFVESDPRLQKCTEEQYANVAAKLVAAIATMKAMEEKAQQSSGRLLFFKTVPCVYDLGVDTNGPEISYVKDEGGNAAEILEAMTAYATDNGWKVKAVNLGLGENGAASDNGVITVGKWLGDATQVSVLAHEIAHQQLHLGDNKDIEIANETRELQAEAVAYAVTRHFGMKAEMASTYISSFGQTPGDVMQNLGVICRTSRAIIEGVRAKIAVKEGVDQEEPTVTAGEDEVEVRYYLRAGTQKERHFDDYQPLLEAIHNHEMDLKDIQLDVYAAGIGGSFYIDRTVTAKEFVDELFHEFVERARESGVGGFVFDDRGVSGSWRLWARCLRLCGATR